MAEKSVYVDHLGEVVDFGPALVGSNLNMLVVRGFGSLDALAAISGPDVYDQVHNPEGTQRDLKSKHAEECFEYAINSLAEAAEEKPRCFPEIILNARDAGAIELYNLDDPQELFDLDSFSDLSDVGVSSVGVRVRLTDLELPKPMFSPQISRVDGNHRLSVADDTYDGDLDDLADLEFPSVPFTLLLGLTRIQEARLFRDINGEHQGMETAHLDTMMYRITATDEMKSDPRKRALWLAHQLAEDGRAFEGMVFFGGSQRGVKDKHGAVPPIKINALKTTVASQLKHAPNVMAHAEGKPERLLELLDRFWKAVREQFADAWNDKKEYILLQSIGLGAFAKFGGITLDRAWDAASVEPEDFATFLAPVAKNVSLLRDDYPGIAGAGGADFVAKRLIAAADPDHVKAEKILASLGSSGSSATALDDEPADQSQA